MKLLNHPERERAFAVQYFRDARPIANVWLEVTARQPATLHVVEDGFNRVGWLTFGIGTQMPLPRLHCRMREGPGVEAITLPPAQLRGAAHEPGELGHVGVAGDLRAEAVGADAQVAQRRAFGIRTLAEHFGELGHYPVELVAERGVVKRLRQIVNVSVVAVAVVGELFHQRVVGIA